MRALASPPFPAQLSAVNPSSEFPDHLAISREAAALERQLGGLRVPPEVLAGASSEALAALSALRSHLARMHADQELATKAQAVCDIRLWL